MKAHAVFNLIQQNNQDTVYMTITYIVIVNHILVINIDILKSKQCLNL